MISAPMIYTKVGNFIHQKFHMWILCVNKQTKAKPTTTNRNNKKEGSTKDF
jgi:hypothetical protein